MCLIIYCPKGYDKTNPFLNEAITKAEEYNPDGMGYALKREDGTLYMSKGYFEVGAFKEAISNQNIQINDELLVHLRIGNKGAVNVNMCHPFLVSDNEDEISGFEEGLCEKPVVAHNGTMLKHSLKDSDKSDTFYFIRDVLSKEYVLDFIKKDYTLFDSLAQSHLASSRLALMFPGEERSVLLGLWYKEDGIYFSKDYKKEYFKDNITNTYNSWQRRKSPSNFNYDYAYSDFDDYYDGRAYGNEDDLFSSDTYEEGDWNTSGMIITDSRLVMPNIGVARDSFKNAVGVKHIKYMGLYFPLKETVSKFSPCISDFASETNVNIYCYKTDALARVFVGLEYTVIDFTDESVIVRETWSKKEIEFTFNDFHKFMKIRMNKFQSDFYEEYYELVEEVDVTKTAIKKMDSIINNAIRADKNTINFRGIMGIDLNVAILFSEKAKIELRHQEAFKLLN